MNIISQFSENFEIGKMGVQNDEKDSFEKISTFDEMVQTALFLL